MLNKAFLKQPPNGINYDNEYNFNGVTPYSNKQMGTPPPGSPEWMNIVTLSAGSYFASQLGFGLNSIGTAQGLYFRSRWADNTDVTWFSWIPLATATPPEWHNAPLETGWSWTAQGRYGKDGSGTGYLVGAVNKASAPLSSEAIVRLPTGFRPPVLWPVSFSSAGGTDGSSWATYGYLWPDGYLRFHGGALPANYSVNQGIAFSVVYPCTA